MRKSQNKRYYYFNGFQYLLIKEQIEINEDKVKIKIRFMGPIDHWIIVKKIEIHEYAESIK
jgi:hypothetical protein